MRQNRLDSALISDKLLRECTAAAARLGRTAFNKWCGYSLSRQEDHLRPSTAHSRRAYQEVPMMTGWGLETRCAILKP